jgi:arsenite methyltransferase
LTFAGKAHNCDHMLPIHKLIWHEWRAQEAPRRIPEPSEAMEDPEQIRAYVKAYEWGGPTSALQMHHLTQLASMIRPGDTVLDLACGPGPLLLELAPLYPDCRFIGADLSPRMLQALRETAAERGIGNIETVCEDIRHMPSIAAGSVDMVITTSALHHLPDLECLGQVFERVHKVLKPDGGLYIFDFGQVRSAATRELLVREVARTAPAVTATDYAHSLAAAFNIDEVLSLVRSRFTRAAMATSSRFVDFFYFVRTADRGPARESVSRYVNMRRSQCPWPVKLEALMLANLQRPR